MRSPDQLRAAQALESSRAQFSLMRWMLLAVVLLNVLPLGIGLVRRPPDNIAANTNQNTLLLTGSFGSALGALIGYTVASAKEPKKNTPDPNAQELDPPLH
jgi:hypothetical protein